jgi:hypothetical protein
MRQSAVASSVLLMAWVLWVPTTAHAFGTIDGAGQRREHERITRAALACTGAVAQCFQPDTIAQLAGHGNAFGGVGAPDSDEIANPAAHCDDADFLESNYPRTREQAAGALTACVDHLRTRFREAVDSAQGLLDDEGNLVPDAVGTDPACEFFRSGDGRAKCATLGAFGRALHGVQDFYAHSNWADEADPDRPIGDTNPPGLDLPGPSPLLDLRGGSTPAAPPDLSTGCFVLPDQAPGVGACTGRVTHAALNKDTGLIDPRTGAATDPTTGRGAVGDNFAKAVEGAIRETRRQWRDLRAELRARYGADRAGTMTCALTHDDPVEDCQGMGAATIAVIAVIAATAVVTLAGLLLASRRRRAELAYRRMSAHRRRA